MERQVGIHIEGKESTVEFFRRNPDDRGRFPIQQNSRADDGSIATKSLLPEGVAEHHADLFALILSLAWEQNPAEQGPDSKRPGSRFPVTTL